MGRINYCKCGEKEGLCENRGREEGYIGKGKGAGKREDIMRKEFGRKREKCVRERRRGFMGRVRTVCRKGEV